MTGSIYATWCISNNFGDALNPWLIKKLTGKTPVYTKPDSYYEKYMLVGSILNWANKDTIVWGAGIANTKDTIDPECVILATRGVLTRNKAHIGRKEETPEVHGDPALLLPRLYEPTSSKKYDLGIIPHYVDQGILQATPLAKNSNIKIINVFDSIETIIEEVSQCRYILSSSLHGLVVADAYGIPNKWFEASNEIGGDGFKFKDHLITMGKEIYEPLKLYKIQNLSVGGIIEEIGFDALAVNTDKLWASCPFK